MALAACVATMVQVAGAPVGTCPAVDPINRSILLPDSSDCTLYYMCSNGAAILMYCPPGLHFNPVSNVCDWPANANCKKQCSPLADNRNGVWQPASCGKDTSEIGDRCSLQCNGEFELKGSAFVECTDNGWNSSNGENIPICLPPVCIGENIDDDLNKTLSVKAGLLFILDESGSVQESDFIKTKEFVKKIISKFELSENRSAGVITFSSTAVERIRLSESSTSSFLSAVDRIDYRAGGTDILSSLNAALNEINNYAIHNLTLVFLITDGDSTTDGTPAADKIKAAGHPLFTIGVAQTRLLHLESLASAGDNGIKHFFHIRSYAVLESIGQYINPPSGSNSSEDKTQCLEPTVA